MFYAIIFLCALAAVIAAIVLADFIPHAIRCTRQRLRREAALRAHERRK